MQPATSQNNGIAQAGRWIQIIGIGSATATLLIYLFDRGSNLVQWIALLTAGPAWYAAIRLLLVKTRLRKTWIGWISLTVVFLVLFQADDTGFIIALSMSAVFLTFRLYRPYRLLTSYQRITLGLMSVLFMVVLPGQIGIREGAGWIVHFIHQVGIWSIWSLKIYFGFSMVYLFFGMRLHFLRLKPKLMVTGFFLAVVPLTLLATFSILSLVNFLERDRAAIAHRILESSALELIQEEPGGPGEYFLAEYSGDDLQLTGTGEPAWLTPVLRALRPDPAAIDSAVTAEPITRMNIPSGDEGGGMVVTIGSRTDTLGGVVWTPADSILLFMDSAELWVLDVRGIDDDVLSIKGARIDDAFVDGIASEVGSNFHILDSNDEDDRRLTLAGFRNPEERAASSADSSRGFHIGTLGFSMVPIMIAAGSRLVTDTVVLQITPAPFQIMQDLASGPRTMDRILIIGLIFFAILFFIIELGALFLGIRITRGFTSAVSELHAGTRKLAEGELDTRIEIENRDELGDLAESFNEMTIAVQKGREEAIARERLEKELETARSIQERLLPDDMPDVPGFEFAATNISSLQVGGDYFDFVETGKGRTGVVIADVSGKGIPAALLMANLQAALQGQAIHPGKVAAVVGRVNELLTRSSDVHMYATFFYGVLDRKSGAFTYCNAGHNPPVVQRADGTQEFLEAGGIVVGMMGGIAYEEGTVKIGPGDTIVMYTDGVSEAVGPDEEPEPEKTPLPDGEATTGTETEGAEPIPVVTVEVDEEEDEDEQPEENMYGEERLYELLSRTVGQNALQIRDTILSEITEFSAGMPQSDDITVVVVRRLPED